MREFICNEPSAAAHAELLLAHGAGAAMDTPFMEAIATGLADKGIRVSRFEFPYMSKRREDGKRRGPDTQRVLLQTWRDVIDQQRTSLPLFIGGKSMGGRMASLIAGESEVSGLVCLGYPFHPAGRPEQVRIEHLQSLACPTLIVQGERDSFGRPDELADYALADSIELTWVPDGDHSFKPRKSSGRTPAENLALAVEATAGFILSHLP